MHAIKNNLTKKLGSLVSNGSTLRYSIGGMLVFIFLVGWISKAVGLGHSSIQLTFILALVFCFALLLGSALLNQTPKAERRSLREKDLVAWLLLLLLIGVAAVVLVSNLLSIWTPSLNVFAGVAAVVGLYILIPILAMLATWGIPSFKNDPFLIKVVDHEYPLPAHATYAAPPASPPYIPPRPRA